MDKTATLSTLCQLPPSTVVGTTTVSDMQNRARHNFKPNDRKKKVKMKRTLQTNAVFYYLKH